MQSPMEGGGILSVKLLQQISLIICIMQLLMEGGCNVTLSLRLERLHNPE